MICLYLRYKLVGVVADFLEGMKLFNANLTLQIYDFKLSSFILTSVKNSTLSPLYFMISAFSCFD